MIKQFSEWLKGILAIQILIFKKVIWKSSAKK